MNNRLLKIIWFRAFIGISVLLVFGGCSQKKDVIPDMISDIERDKIHTKPYQLKITPIIGTRQDDAKVVMDMGKIIKVWVAPYKDGKTLVSSHDNYVVAQAPDFIIGESVPNKNWKGLVAPENKIPFLFRDSELDNANKIEEEEIIKYNNIVYQQQNDTNESVKRLEKTTVFDSEIKKFLDQ
ncbi:hypothetical protein [Sulfurimonas sp.]|uniref:hypothetical protein n=1 Tax=Sulfurimonas sp. TaxID=2022749 RepID=UPI0025E6443E|nr:hypothetical protein [Sulfurimonas sp.]MBW6487561.1 hypothetical protein [Sulfurimonas sp.]